MTSRGWAFATIVSAMVAFLALAGPARADRRVALVIGNAAYLDAPRLKNPANDAADMRAKLKALGFELHGGDNLDRTAFVAALRTFGRAAETSDVALVFYAGHGIQASGQNYLVPVDARVEYEPELGLVLVPFDEVLRQLNRGPAVKIVMLDACRDNPFAKTLSRTLGTRSTEVLGRGLTVVQRVSGTYIAYATQPDAVAQDGDGRNSPFTAALLRHMDAPGTSLPDMMVEVRRSVMTATGGRQVPWDTSSLTGHFAFRPAAAVAAPARVAQGAVAPPPAAPAAASAPDDPRLADMAAWLATQGSSDPRDFETYLKTFPQGLYARQARERLAALRPAAQTAAPSTSLAAPAPSPPAPAAPETPPVAAPAAAAEPGHPNPDLPSPLLANQEMLAGLTALAIGAARDLMEKKEPPPPPIDPAILAKLAETPLASIPKSPALMADALKLGETAFAKNCVACHGVGADPVAGPLAPRDRSWLWGGDLAAVHQSIQWGIRTDNAKMRGMWMPAFGSGEILKSKEIAELAVYVDFLSDKTLKPTEYGRKSFAENCAACHGDRGTGNPEMGTPDLTGAVRMYGRGAGTIAQITDPRHGSCAAWEPRLGAATVKALALWVQSKNPPAPATTRRR